MNWSSYDSEELELWCCFQEWRWWSCAVWISTEVSVSEWLFPNSWNLDNFARQLVNSHEFEILWYSAEESSLSKCWSINNKLKMESMESSVSCPWKSLYTLIGSYSSLWIKNEFKEICECISWWFHFRNWIFLAESKISNLCDWFSFCNFDVGHDCCVTNVINIWSHVDRLSVSIWVNLLIDDHILERI